MVNTIKKSLSPVFLITFLLGLGILYPLDELRYRLSIVYILTMWSVYAYALYWAMSVVKNVINSLAVFTIIVNLFVAMISIIITFCEHKKYQQFMKKLEHVDDTLEELETSKEYCRMQNFIRLILITWSVMTCISWIIDSLLCLTVSNDIRAILIPCILNYFTHANTITDITFMLLLRHIGSKLDKINDQIEQLSEIKDYGLSCKWNKYPIVSRHNVQDTDRKRVLWITM
ncbi:PREDICTED: uncharacterized protein LOC105459939 [Wasmannia auropunctata]|uniref:uncharacterized protein LOC105459939 n=1 Tax=Wasmannia auropunctata TaxID=64793 RepID=UPI0005EF3CE6|nr:PREDICTED: uncharacterized protein LOC105459939 [Wasmannia auropunctata]